MQVKKKKELCLDQKKIKEITTLQNLSMCQV